MTTAYFTCEPESEQGQQWSGRSSKLLQITKTNNNQQPANNHRDIKRGQAEGDVIEFNQNCLVHQTDNYKQYILPISQPEKDNPTMPNSNKKATATKSNKQAQKRQRKYRTTPLLFAKHFIKLSVKSFTPPSRP